MIVIGLTMRIKLIFIVSVMEVVLIVVMVMKVKSNLHRKDEDNHWRLKLLLSISTDHVALGCRLHPSTGFSHY